MRVALTGVSGFIGSVTARHLAEAGHAVTGLVRPTSRRDHIEPYVDRLVEGDQDDENAWPALLEDADCVIHNSVDWSPLAAPVDFDRHIRSNLVGSLRLLARSAPRQFVLISTIAVHHDMRPRWAGRIDEDHPMRPATLYGACKAAVESHLWAAHFGDGRSVCAFRPCGVYGIDPRLDRSIGHPIILRLREEQRFSKLGGGKFVHVDDVAAAITAAVGNPAADGAVYNLVDCFARWGDWATIAADLMGIDAEIDLSSPPAPKNSFVMDAARSLGVGFDRGLDGIREHLRELIDRIDRS